MLFILGLLMLPSVLATDGKVKVTRINDRIILMELSSPKSMSIKDAQAALLGTALDACKGLSPSFGKYKFNFQVPLSSSDGPPPEPFLFAQEIECAGHEAAGISQHRTEISDSEKARIGSMVQSITDRYFAQAESGNFEASYEMLSDYMQSISPRSSWVAKSRDFHGKAGAKISGGVSRVTVYVDPPDAPSLGIYVAADYEIHYERVPLHCGYVVWFRGADGSFRLSREESGY
ncbi:MAG: DUF4019 domain-containing protein, partial [Gammaproteobacteria bacterium]